MQHPLTPAATEMRLKALEIVVASVITMYPELSQLMVEVVKFDKVVTNPVAALMAYETKN